MRALWRLAGWGFAATAALAVAVLTAYSSRGHQRLGVAIAALTGTGPQQLADVGNTVAPPAPVVVVPYAAELARLTETENETRQLTEMVRALTEDRKRLQTRLAAIERNLEDVTGSIRRQAMAPANPSSAPAEPPPAPAAEPAPVSPPASPAEEPAVSAALPSIATAAPQTAPEAVQESRVHESRVHESPVQDSPVQDPPAQPPVQHSVAAGWPAGAQAAEVRERPQAGIDIGGAATFDGLRTLWHSTLSAHAAVLDGLHAVVGVGETSRRGADLRLIVGPLADAQAAAQICAALGRKRACHQVPFEGRPLALLAPDLPPRPPPKRKPTPRPPAPAPTPSYP